MGKELTAVEWFSEKTFNQIELFKRQIVNQHEFLDNMIKLRDKAKEMEKEQIMNAFDDCGNWQDNYTDSEHYYNETYGGNK